MHTQLRQGGPAGSEYAAQVAEQLDRHGLHLFGAMPRSSLLRSLGCDEVMAALDCKPLLSGEGIDQISTSGVAPTCHTQWHDACCWAHLLG